MARIRNRFMEIEFPATDGTYVLGLAGVAGRIARWRTVINAAVATNDAVCTLKAAGTSVSGGAITITASGSAQGDVDEALSCQAVVNPTTVLTVVVTGTPGSAAQVRGHIEIEL